MMEIMSHYSLEILYRGNELASKEKCLSANQMVWKEKIVQKYKNSREME